MGSNIYKAVDVSHFKNGCTECVRPVSEESLAFVGTLLQEKPSREALDAALAEHKARIKACKLGQGPNRHFLGLKLMAAKEGGELPEIYKDEGYQTFTTDFLSTSTVGDNSTVVNFAFAPTSVGGLGINYTSRRRLAVYGKPYSRATRESQHIRRCSESRRKKSARIS